MIRYVFLRLLVAAMLCVLAPQVHAIVNGEPVTDEQFAADYPWATVVVKMSNGGICGGALIAPRWVVTAAHCTGLKKYILVGDARRSKARRIELKRVMRHPDFDRNTLQNDVGLLYLAEALDIVPVAIASEAEAQLLLLPGATAVIAGWGKPAYRQPPSERLVEGQATLMGLVKRGSQYIYDDPNTGPCGLDSGGPMVMETLDGRRVLVGVASATDGNLCAKGGGIAIYTNLSVVYEFIEKQRKRFPAD